MSCHFGYQGEKSVATPALIGSPGKVSFFPCLCHCPVCSTFRSALITGMYQNIMHTITAVPGKLKVFTRVRTILNFSTKRDILQPTVMQLSRDAAKKITTLIMKVQTCMTGSTGVNANRTSHSLPKFNYAAVNTAILRKPIRRSVRNCLPPLIQNP